MKLTYFIIVCVFLFVYACSSEKEKKEKTVCAKPGEVTNPNGMSEMSQIMEDWYTSMKIISEELRAGRMVKNVTSFDEQKVLVAKTTKTDLKKEQFEAFSHSFFYNYNEIVKASSLEDQRDKFNLTVTACVNCHEQYCHGPMVRIKKLSVISSTAV